MECFVLKAERLKLCTVTQNRKKSYCFSSSFSSSSSHSKTASVQKANRCFQGTSHDDKIIINIGERSKRPSHTWGWHQSVLKESWDDAVGKKKIHKTTQSCCSDPLPCIQIQTSIHLLPSPSPESPFFFFLSSFWCLFVLSPDFSSGSCQWLLTKCHKTPTTAPEGGATSACHFDHVL